MSVCSKQSYYCLYVCLFLKTKLLFIVTFSVLQNKATIVCMFVCSSKQSCYCLYVCLFFKTKLLLFVCLSSSKQSYSLYVCMSVHNKSVIYVFLCSGDDISGLVDDSGVEEGGDNPLPEGIYNVPRNLTFSDTLPPNMAIQSSPMSAGSVTSIIPIAGGIYDVPRSLLCKTLTHTHTHASSVSNYKLIPKKRLFLLVDGVPQTVVGENGVEFHMSGNPFDLYDIPRSALDPSLDDDATIYDYPLDFDLDDMEIYDYPPDAAELGNLIY